MDQLPHQLPDSVVINIEYLQEYITNISFGVSNIFLYSYSHHIYQWETLILFSVENIILNISILGKFCLYIETKVRYVSLPSVINV